MKMSNRSLSKRFLILILSLIFFSAHAQRETAAVAIGDSFISGEGAGNYMSVEGNSFPSWNGRDAANPFFCHRSANASIFQADLPGIDRRFNLACSGGQPRDVLVTRPPQLAGRNMPPQLDQLMDVATDHDVKLILIGLGSNNREFTFGGAVIKCIGKFMFDAYVVGPQDNGCTRSDLASDRQFDRARGFVIEAVDEIIQAMSTLRDSNGRLRYPPGSFRIVMQDYTNPLPKRMHPNFNTENGKSDTNGLFKKLAQERYRFGCTIHQAALDDGHWFSEKLGGLVAGAKNELSRRYPLHDIVYLNVQRAFDGARLCESVFPGDNLASPFYVRNARGGVINNIDNRNSFVDVLRLMNVNDSLINLLFGNNGVLALAEHCTQNFQRCQEAWHPNTQGHAMLGQCLSGAYESSSQVVKCIRNTFTGQPIIFDPPPQVAATLVESVHWAYLPQYGRSMPELTLNYSMRLVDAGLPARPMSWKLNVANHPQVLSIDDTYGGVGSSQGLLRMIIDDQTDILNLGFGLEATLTNGRRVIGGATISSNVAAARPSGPGLGM
ncbi:hypothetical protein [Marinicella sp. W31]|uniref:hypothetical protein n=1 Tax=Marinicella sp. W31 TaxID=3023713 RepID=UPI0037570368